MIRKYLKEYNSIGGDKKQDNASPEKKRFASSCWDNVDIPTYDSPFNDCEPDNFEPDSDNNEKIFEGSCHSKFDYCMSVTMLAR